MGAHGTHSLICFLAGSKDRLTICGCFAGYHCALTCFYGTDVTGAGCQVSVQTSVTVCADLVN